jgi:glucose/arabinose dehydrogenase
MQMQQHTSSILFSARRVFSPLLLFAACMDDSARPVTGPNAQNLRIASTAVAPPAASLSVLVQVPASMRYAPFDVDRYLTIPPNFSIAVYARLVGARFMAAAPNGDLLVSNPGAGSIYIIRPGASGGDPTISTWASGLNQPHDIVFHTLSGTTYVYIGETDKVARYTYTSGDVTGQGRQVVISTLPGGGGHPLKNIALTGNSLYVAIASSCNVCLSDTQSNPVRGSVYVYSAADGTGGRLFARGVRNAEGLAVVPGTSTLWVVINNRDNIAYPFHNDWNNDGTGDDYGKLMQSYVDNHPPDEFTRVRDGGNYGWPFCNPDPDSPSGMNSMPFNRDVDLNADGTQLECSTADRIDKGIQAHSAPLGMIFLQGTNAPSAYQNGAVVPLHGSWNRAAKTGYKVVYFPWDPTMQLPDAEMDLVAGWLMGGTNWGRPVDAAVAPDGGIYISDDLSGTIYKLSYTAPPPPPPPPPPPSEARFTKTCSGFTCLFDGSSSRRALSYSWNFGDGTTASGVTASHTFATAKANYLVTLVTTPSGDHSTKTKQVKCSLTRCS